MIAGGDVAKMPGSLVYSFLAVTELMSIIENPIEMGMDVLKPWQCGLVVNVMKSQEGINNENSN